MGEKVRAAALEAAAKIMARHQHWLHPPGSVRVLYHDPENTVTGVSPENIVTGVSYADVATATLRMAKMFEEFIQTGESN